MEARSLTALNELAANPPQYPEKPLDGKQQSLTLYISRVPGTRDVLLSTYKPQERNVTAEDVSNSLYYIHLNDADEPNVPGQIRDETTWRSSEESVSSPLTIPRKPVADRPHSSTPESQTNTTKLPLPLPLISNDSDASRNDLSSENDAFLLRKSRISLDVSGSVRSTANGQLEANTSPNTLLGHERTAAGLHTGMPARKPIGTRPMTSASAAATLSDNPQAAARGDSKSTPKSQSAQLPGLVLETSMPEHGVAGSNLMAHPIQYRPASQPPNESWSPRKQSVASSVGAGTSITLTIIRRDPSSGQQWNIGRVSSRQFDTAEDGDVLDTQLLSSSSPPMPSTSQPYPPINIELENSGYAKFRNMAFRKNCAPEGGDRSSAKGGIGVFSRQVAMRYSISLRNCVVKKFQQASRHALSRHRSDSVGSVLSNASDITDAVESIVTRGPPPPGMKARGYVFDSPWDGRCEFQTGNAGRSLDCRHTPHEFTTSANYNPLVADQNSMNVFKSSSRPVSELRFNLPSAEIWSEHAKNSKEQWKGNLEKFLKQSGGAKDHDDGHNRDDGAVSPFKLNLGSEQAGGGISGRDVKLGKLIVHDEGLKMLDLVVAANMGVWWGTWEKRF